MTRGISNQPMGTNASGEAYINIGIEYNRTKGYHEQYESEISHINQ